MAMIENVDDDNVMIRIQATARPPSPSPPTPDARGAIVTTRIATTTTIHAAAAARIKGETTRALRIVGRTRRGTGITTRLHTTTNKRRTQQEVEPPAERRREAPGQHNNQTNKRGMMEQREADAPAEGFGEAERATDKRSGRRERQQRLEPKTNFVFVIHLNLAKLVTN